MKRAACVLLTLVFLLWLAPASAWGQRGRTAPLRPKKVPVSRPVRDLPTLSPDQVRELVPRRRRPIPPESKGGGPTAVRLSVDALDPAAQTSFGPEAPTAAGVNTDGLGDGVLGFTVGSAPPDTDGAVGRTQYVQMVNTSFAVFDKVTMTKLTGPTATNALWSTIAGTNPCKSTNDGDGIVLYDQLADRWILTQFANALSATGPFYECVAVSKTGDATGQYFLYFFSYSNFNDYPKMGVWPDAYYLTYNAFTPAGAGAGGIFCAFDRERMLDGLTTRGAAGPSGAGGLPAGNNQVCFNIQDFGVLPSDLDGTTLPPSGSPNFGLEWFNTTNLGLWKFHVDWTTLTNSTMNGVAWVSPSGPTPSSISPVLISVASFTPTCSYLLTGNQVCVPQLGTIQQLDSITDRLMHRLAYRNFGTRESLVLNHTVLTSSRGAVRWYEVQNPNGTPSVAQTGTWSPDTNWRWMGSMAMDKFGNIALGYSKSGSIRPAIAYATRLSTDTPGLLADEVTVVAGAGSQTGGLDRWGDYSTMSVDPQDDCTFWYTNEYLAASGSFNWQTRIASFKLAQCQSQPFNLSITPNSGSGSSQSFSFLYSDTAGAAAITVAQGLVNTTASTASACAFRYNRAANTLQLYLNDGVTLSSAVTPGSAGTLSNSQCSINIPTSSAATAGNHLVVTVAVTFAGGFSGTKNLYMNVADTGGTTTGWQTFGTWTVP